MCRGFLNGTEWLCSLEVKKVDSYCVSLWWSNRAESLRNYKVLLGLKNG